MHEEANNERYKPNNLQNCHQYTYRAHEVNTNISDILGLSRQARQIFMSPLKNLDKIHKLVNAQILFQFTSWRTRISFSISSHLKNFTPKPEVASKVTIIRCAGKGISLGSNRTYLCTHLPYRHT